MQFQSYNHLVFLREENGQKFVEKVGHQFPERILREYEILTILSKLTGIPQIESTELNKSVPSLKLKYIDAREYNCIEEENLTQINIQIARWLRKFATSSYVLPSQINSKYSVSQRDIQAFKKVKATAKKISSQKILTCLDRVQKYQKRDRIYCSHRDLRIDHVLVKDNDIWVVDWESASNGYILQDAGNFIASVIKQDIRKTRYLNTFVRELSLDLSNYALQELLDWTIFSLVWESHVQERLNYAVKANNYLNSAQKLLAKKNLNFNAFNLS